MCKTGVGGHGEEDSDRKTRTHHLGCGGKYNIKYGIKYDIKYCIKSDIKKWYKIMNDMRM